MFISIIQNGTLIYKFLIASLKMFALIIVEQANGSRHRDSAKFVKKLLAWIKYEETHTGFKLTKIKLFGVESGT